MEQILIILGIIAFAIWLIWYLTACPHSWKVIQRYEIMRKSDDKLVGYAHVKECEYCKSLKKETIHL